MDYNNLPELQKITENEKQYTFDFDKNTLVYKSRMLKIMLIAFTPICIILNVQMIFLQYIGMLPAILTAFITIAAITAIFMRSKDFIKLNFDQQIIEKQSLMRLTKINFSEIQNLQIIKYSPYRSFTTIYLIEAKIANETINLFGNKNESVSIEILNWLNKYYLKKQLD